MLHLVAQTRLLPVRRLSRPEADLLGFAGPLVLTRRQHRVWVLPWRSGRYVVTRGVDEEVLEVSAAELGALGVGVQAPPG